MSPRRELPFDEDELDLSDGFVEVPASATPELTPAFDTSERASAEERSALSSLVEHDAMLFLHGLGPLAALAAWPRDSLPA